VESAGHIIFSGNIVIMAVAKSEIGHIYADYFVLSVCKDSLIFPNRAPRIMSQRGFSFPTADQLFYMDNNRINFKLSVRVGKEFSYRLSECYYLSYYKCNRLLYVWL
jgi:hypothetical protein